MNGDTELTEAETVLLPPLGAQWLVWIGQELHTATTRLGAMELYKAAKAKGRETVVYTLTDHYRGDGSGQHKEKPQQEPTA